MECMMGNNSILEMESYKLVVILISLAIAVFLTYYFHFVLGKGVIFTPAFIWILRVYKLKDPYWAEPTPGVIKYANLKNEVSLEGIEPVLTDSQFNKVLDNLI